MSDTILVGSQGVQVAVGRGPNVGVQVGTSGPKGPPGPSGPAGPPGPKGDPGTSVNIVGSVPTSANLPTNLTQADAGKGYIANDTGHLWVWSGTSWSDAGKIQGPPGPAGPTGPKGDTGSAGPAGATGPPGSAGTAGVQGPKGDTGLQGPSGATGSQGPAGSPGATGSAGAQGPQGDPGPAGTAGAQGPKGDKGDAGSGVTIKGTITTWPPPTQVAGDMYLLGSPVPAGAPNPATGSKAPGDGVVYSGSAWSNVGPIRGPEGPPGPTGATGSTGNQGPAGAQGGIGPQGPQGLQGPKGDTGDQGIQGAPGSQGIPGTPGATGSTGAQGPAGPGVPTGGTTSQVLAKSSNADYATGWVGLTKTDVGLGNVDNTSDVSKPVSTAQQTALNLKADKATTVTASAPLTGSGTLGAALTIGIADFTTTSRGAVPNPTATSGRFLKDDGTWAAVPASGATILNGTGVPASGTGTVGDYYEDTAAGVLYGPKQPIGTAEQRITIGNTPTTNFNFEFGIVVLFAQAGTVTKIRYQRLLNSTDTIGIRMWNSVGTKVSEVLDTHAGQAGYFEVTLPTPISVAAGSIYTFSMGATGSGVAYSSSGTWLVTNTADMTVTGRSLSTTPGNYPNSSDNSNIVVVEPTFIPTNPWPITVRTVAGYQPLDTDLTTIAGLTATTNNFMVAQSSAWASVTPATARTALGLVIGTNVQAWDADLDTWATKTAPTGTVVGTSDTQTLTGKTLTSPVINTPTGIVKGDVGLGNVDNTSDATKNSAVATLTNKTIALGSNTVSGTLAQFNTAITDADVPAALNGLTGVWSGTQAEYDAIGTKVSTVLYIVV